MAKRILIPFFILSLLSPAIAHPPSGATASYDTKSQVLTVIISHNSINTGLHHVGKVMLTANGKEFSTQTFDDQYDGKRQVVMAVIPKLKNDLKITAKAICNVFGTLEKEITVPTKEAL